MSAEVARERAARGAALLDVTQPEWVSRVDPKTLAVSDPENCVLGQVYGDYDEAINALNLDARGQKEFGFDCEYKPFVGAEAPEPVVRFSELTSAWREILDARREAVPV